MKKQLLLHLIILTFSGIGYAQTDPASAPKQPLNTKLNPNTDARNRQTPNEPAPATTPAPTESRSNTGATSGRQSGKNTSSSQKRQKPAQEATPAPVPAAAQSAPTVKEIPATTPSQSASGAEKPPAESPAAAAKRQLIADGYKVCMTHPDYGKVYCDEAQAKVSKGHKASYFYIDEDGIAVPIEASIFSDKKNTQKVAGPKVPVNDGPAPLPKADRPVNRWVSPFLGDWLTIQPGFISDLTLINTGYKNKTFQYNAYQWLPDHPDATAVYSWNMPKCPNCFILFAEHEFSDSQLASMGYTNKIFQFFALKNRPAEGNFVAVNRWINALPAGNGCRDYTLSVTEKEFTDAQLLSWGYTNKVVQFYVPSP